MRTLLAVCLIFVAYGAAADSLFSEEVEDEGTLISDQKVKFEEGDIITVLVMESINSRTRADTETEKESDIIAIAPTAANPFLVANPPTGNGIFNPGELPNWNIGVENEHEARGLTRRDNTITTTIACVVTKTYENGNIEIEGEKVVQVNREETNVVVSGLVRGRDVTPGNTILSTQIANAKVLLKGSGPLWNNQRRGLLTKILDWFSPF